MSTLRISNIEAKSVPASATIDEKVKITNSSGDVLVFLDGKTSGITTVGINTTDGNITFDANSNVVVTGIITATKFVGTIEPTNLTVGGDLTIPDKIIHSGDTNTAIRFPAADTISFETVGSERLRIDSNGTLQVQGDGYAYLQLERYQNNTGSSRVRFVKSRSDTVGTNAIVQDGDQLGAVDFYGSDSNSGTRGAASISAEVDGTPGSADMPGRLIFKTVPDGSTVFTERLRITSAGKVGINSTAPTNMLDVAGTADVLGLYRNDFTGNSGAGLNLNFGRARADGSLFNAAKITAVGSDNTAQAGELRFSVLTSGSMSEKLRITSDGDMGLGTGGNTVTQRLDVRESSSTVFNPSSNLPTIARLYNTSSTNGASAGLQLRTDNNNGAAGIQYIHAVNSSTNYDSDLVFSRRIATSGSYAEACRITNAGNLKFPNGKGIDFSATVNGSGFSQELLDDYEEGNFNGVDVSGGGLTLSYNNTGRYVKVGRQVYVIFDITYPSNSDNNLTRVSNPYNADMPYGSGWVGWNELGRPMQVHVSGANVYFMDCNSSGTAKHLYNSELSGKRIIGGYMLMTNS